MPDISLACFFWEVHVNFFINQACCGNPDFMYPISKGRQFVTKSKQAKP